MRPAHSLSGGQNRLFSGWTLIAGPEAAEAGHSPRAANKLPKLRCDARDVPYRHDVPADPREAQFESAQERRRSARPPKVTVRCAGAGDASESLFA